MGIYSDRVLPHALNVACGWARAPCCVNGSVLDSSATSSRSASAPGTTCPSIQRLLRMWQRWSRRTWPGVWRAPGSGHRAHRSTAQGSTASPCPSATTRSTRHSRPGPCARSGRGSCARRGAPSAQARRAPALHRARPCAGIVGVSRGNDASNPSRNGWSAAATSPGRSWSFWGRRFHSDGGRRLLREGRTKVPRRRLLRARHCRPDRHHSSRQ